MTFSHAINIKPASATGGLSITVGQSFELSEKDPEAAFRDIVDANAHPLGAIISREDGHGIRETLGLARNEVIIVRTRVSNGSASYMLLLSTPFTERPSK